MSYADVSLPYIWYFCVRTHICLAFGNEFIVTELLFTMRLSLSIACLPSSQRARFQRTLQTEKSLFLFLKFFRELPGSPSEALAFPTFFQVSDDINRGVSIKCWLLQSFSWISRSFCYFSATMVGLLIFHEAKIVNPFIYIQDNFFFFLKLEVGTQDPMRILI